MDQYLNSKIRKVSWASTSIRSIGLKRKDVRNEILAYLILSMVSYDHYEGPMAIVNTVFDERTNTAVYLFFNAHLGSNQTSDRVIDTKCKLIGWRSGVD